MRKLILAAATAVSALAVTAPASAQYFPQPRGNAYGYNNYGLVRSYQARVANLQRTVDRMAQRGARSRELYQLRREVGELQYQVNAWGRNGLSQREARELEWRIARVEQMARGARYASRGGYNGYQGYNGYNGSNYGGDRNWDGRERDRDNDRDGRDDRYEDDRGFERD